MTHVTEKDRAAAGRAYERLLGVVIALAKSKGNRERLEELKKRVADWKA